LISFLNVAVSYSFHHLAYYQSQLIDFQNFDLNIQFVLNSQVQFQDFLQFIQHINFYFYSLHLFYFESNQMLFTDLIFSLESLFVSFSLYFAE
jgi:hypothetical protein